MAEGDNRIRQLGTTAVPGGIDREIAGGVTKANPVDAPRTDEDLERSELYVEALQKDILPEHQARRDTYPHIAVTST